MAPFVVRSAPGISPSLYKALYRVHTADRHGLNGPHAQQHALARLAAMDPSRVRLPDTDDGRRLRTALQANRNHHAKP
ncbi:hypothetical protein OG285_38490 [Streptomyces sp. NBC_01471]|uniref:hypothetical protein n=1 Tax=Streptomyces sp. NBC_01471 TaxID=2903879 RepID=UPI003255DAF9